MRANAGSRTGGADAYRDQLPLFCAPTGRALIPRCCENGDVRVQDLTGKHFEVAQWAYWGYPTPGIAQKMGISDAAATALLREVYAKLDVENRKELRTRYEGEMWEDVLLRIKRFIDQHGHSRIPVDYSDEDGPLGGVVLSIRWHAAGRAGVSPGPFPEIDYTATLNELRGSRIRDKSG